MYKPDSEISRLDRGELALGDGAVHPAVRAVLARCERSREETEGYFDMRAPFSLPGVGATGTAAPMVAY
jgi:thiamine biosynthesis lipoprotein ApbE